MEKDYEGLIAELKRRDAVPLVIIFGKENSGGVDLDFLTTPAYSDADSTLKADIKEVVGKVQNEL